MQALGIKIKFFHDFKVVCCFEFFCVKALTLIFGENFRFVDRIKCFVNELHTHYT